MSFILSTSGGPLRVPCNEVTSWDLYWFLWPWGTDGTGPMLRHKGSRGKCRNQQGGHSSNLGEKYCHPTSLKCLTVSPIFCSSAQTSSLRELSYSPSYPSFRFIPTEQYDLNVEPQEVLSGPKHFWRSTTLLIHSSGWVEIPSRTLQTWVQIPA